MLAVSCADDYEATIPLPEKPEEVALGERLSAYSPLGEYISGDAFSLGVSVDPSDYALKELTYSIVKSNFNQVEAASTFLPSALINDEHAYDFSALSSLVETVGAAGVSVFGPALCTRSSIPSAYLKQVISPTVIPYQPWSESHLLEDFENETVGAQFPSAKKDAGQIAVSIAEDPAGVQGKVLGGTKLTMDIPMTTVTLPEGRKLSDVTKVKLKCYIAEGKPTTTRLQIENAGYSDKKNDYKTTGQWLEYIFNMSDFKFSAAQLELNSFKLAAGAYGSGVSCYIDDIEVQMDHPTGDDTLIEKTDEEKTTLISAELDKWVDGIITTCAGNVTDFIIYDEPLDDEFSTFNWADYLGENYVADVQRKVNAAVESPVRYFVSQTVVLGETTEADVDAVVAYVADLERKGVKVDGVNLAVSANYYLNYSDEVRNEESVAKALQSLSKIHRTVRLSNFSVKVLDPSGMQVNPGALDITQRQAVAELYELVINGYLTSAGSDAYGFSFSNATDNSSLPGPWTSGGSRNFIYEGIVRGLSK